MTLTEQVLTKYPYFIARHYQKLLEAKTSQARVETALHVYEVGIRALALFLISQYLFRDKEALNFEPFNKLLAESVTYATYETWTKIFFVGLEAYKGHADLLFLPQLHDFYWQASPQGYTAKTAAREPFDKMVQIWAEVSPQSSAYPKAEADWETLVDEITTALEQFLQHFTFIEDYEIIRITHKDQHGYWYESRTGQEVALAPTPISTTQVLEVGWYYLRKLKTNELLHLHPLLVLLTNLSSVDDASSESVGFFDHLDKETSYYWEPYLGQLQARPDLMSTVLDWVYFAIERYKAYRHEISQLDWKVLREVCKAISADAMGASHAKYQPELYLQREEVVSAFRDFLGSTKTCFILTGKSGVGKTNFVLSLLDEYQDAGEELCFLVYNGAFLSTDQAIKDAIDEAFNQRLKFQGREEQAQIEDFLWEIDRIPGIKERKFVLIIDAINENGQPALLLKSIDQMVQSVGEGQHWLKIVITSRPEAWRRMYRQAKPLTENRYYQLHGQRELGVEMPEFQIVGADKASDLTYKMPRFGKSEVEVAFEKYRKKFDLRSHYEKLRPAIRQELRDPLIMRLLAEMYQGQDIPTAIRVNEIYQNYVKALIKTEILQAEDEIFLQERIVPLMAEEQYTNEVTASQINQHGLRPQILSRAVDRTGWAVNQSFQNLVDADILTRHESGLDYVIRFTFERFYDYYFGQFLYRQLTNVAQPEPEYFELIKAIQTSPFLWGAVVQALLQHLHKLSAENGYALMTSLARQANQPTKELLVATLIVYNRDEAEIVRGWLDRLLRVDPLDRDEITMSQRVAIEVASKIGHVLLLEEAAMVKSEPIRVVTAQHTYHLWRHNRAAGFGILKRLSGQIKGKWVLPRTEILESCLALSLSILFNHFKEPEVSQELRATWQRIMNDIFYINPTRFGSTWENFKAKVRVLLLRGVVGFSIRSAKELPDQNSLNAIEIMHFWEDEEKAERFALHSELMKVLDPKTSSSQDMRRALLKAVDNRDMICTYLTLIAMIGHLVENPKESLPVVEEFFEKGSQIQPPPPSFGYTPYVFGVLLMRQEKIDPDLWDSFSMMVEKVVELTTGIWISSKRRYRYLWLFPYNPIFKRFYGKGLSPLVSNFLKNCLEEKQIDVIRDFIEWELGFYSVDTGHPDNCLDSLKYILDYGIDDSKVLNSIASVLARLRVRYPELIEDFLIENDVPAIVQNQIKVVGSRETLQDLWSHQALVFWEDVFMLAQDSQPQRMAYWLLGQAPQCKNMSEWMTLLFKIVTNFLYGGPVFPDVPVEWAEYPNTAD